MTTEYEALRERRLQHRFARAADAALASARAAARAARNGARRSVQAFIAWARANPALAASGAGALGVLVLGFLIWRIPEDEPVGQGVAGLSKKEA